MLSSNKASTAASITGLVAAGIALGLIVVQAFNASQTPKPCPTSSTEFHTMHEKLNTLGLTERQYKEYEKLRAEQGKCRQ